MSALSKRYECDWEGCNYTAKYMSYITRHKRKHTGERPYACPLCSHRASLPGDITLHIRRHMGDYRYRCSICNTAKYLTKTEIKRHITAYHNGNMNLIVNILPTVTIPSPIYEPSSRGQQEQQLLLKTGVVERMKIHRINRSLSHLIVSSGAGITNNQSNIIRSTGSYASSSTCSTQSNDDRSVLGFSSLNLSPSLSDTEEFVDNEEIQHVRNSDISRCRAYPLKRKFRTAIIGSDFEVARYRESEMEKAAATTTSSVSQGTVDRMRLLLDAAKKVL